MAQEQDALIVLLPREESAAGEEARQPVRVPLNNRMAPTVKLVQLEEKEPGVYRYEYEFCNASSAQDPIEIVMFKIPLARERFCMSQQSSAASWVAPCAPGAERTQIVHPDFPWTSYSSWIRPLEQPAVEPGQCLGGFSILSDFLPGFKTAGFRGAIIKYAPDRMTWPEEVLHQAGSLEERSWFEKYFTTIGPTFPRETPKENIARSFLEGIDQLAQQGRLDPDSAFLAELSAQLKKWPENAGATGLRLEAGPSSPTERDISRAVLLSLPSDTRPK